MKFVKKHKVLFFFIFCFILGFISMPLFHGGYVQSFLNSFTAIKWYYHILLFIGIFILTLILHELAHFFTFVFLGYENEALIILFFVFYKQNKRWKVTIDFKLLALGGGLAYPNLGDINNQEDFIKAKNAMVKSLIVAPLFTLISGIILFFIVAIFLYKIPLLLVFSLYYFIFSLLYTYVSTKETENIKGDFKAYKHVKTDDLFAMLVLFQYSNISDFTYNLSKENLLTMPKNNDVIQLSFLSYIIEKQIFEDDVVDLEFYNYIYSYLSDSNFKTLLHSLDNFKVAQNLLIYFKKCGFDSDIDQLLTIFMRRLEVFKAKDEHKEYLLKQTLHLLNIENNLEFLTNPNNMNDSELSFIIKHIPSFIEGELNRVKGFKPFVLECDI